MSIEHIYWAAYGFGATGDVPIQFRDMDPYEGEPEEWMTDLQGPGLGFHYGGDNWSGPRAWAVYVKRCKIELEDGALVSLMCEPTLAEMQQLENMRSRLAPEIQTGYYVFHDVM